MRCVGRTNPLACGCNQRIRGVENYVNNVENRIKKCTEYTRNNCVKTKLWKLKYVNKIMIIILCKFMRRILIINQQDYQNMFLGKKWTLFRSLLQEQLMEAFLFSLASVLLNTERKRLPFQGI
jgi:hypothetical protein